MSYIEWREGLRAEFAPQDGVADGVHVFEERQVLAINAALAARRPLLVRGEPGVGKSQMARAAAKALNRGYLHFVIDSQTEARDLLWRVDALARLGEAQIVGALQGATEDLVRERLAVARYLRPGALWWAFDWTDACEQARLSGAARPSGVTDELAANGFVLLIDEIDKAETDVPNGLLEALGAHEMTPPERNDRPVRALPPHPLVIISTNEERASPDAFLRRCMVLKLELPEGAAELKALLMARGRAHFPGLEDEILRKAAELLVTDREAAIRERLRPLPGQAEYLDLLRAVHHQYDGDAQKQSEALDKLAEFTLRKYVG